MRTSIKLTALWLPLSLSILTTSEPVAQATIPSDDAVHITIIYDNYKEDASLETDWGFACMVEYGKEKLLFDAGRKADLYQRNVQKLEINPEEIPALFISHAHGDHTAGLHWITEINPSVKCYLPATYAQELEENDKLPGNSIALAEPTHMYGPFYSTGDDFEAFKEQGLVIKTENGGVLITGCGHPGVIEMVNKAKEKLNIQVHTVVGGLHLLRTPENKVNAIASTLRQMGIKHICPTHCTGDKSIELLETSFGEGYISGGTGKEIIIK